MVMLRLSILVRYYVDALLVNPDRIQWQSSACQSWQDTMETLCLSILARYYGEALLVNPGKILWRRSAC